LDDSRAVQPLIEALRDSSTPVRRQAAWALGAIGDATGVDALVTALKDADAKVREQSAWALGAIGDGRASLGLSLALKDSESGVRRQARGAGRHSINPRRQIASDHRAMIRDSAWGAIALRRRAMIPAVPALALGIGATSAIFSVVA
jgi:HEAT repeat protein